MASAESRETQLLADGLALRRGGRLLFAGLRFQVAPGGALLVTGPNGIGKSSLLRLLAGLLEPAAGRLENPFTTALLGPELALKRDQTLGSELRWWAALDGADDAAVQQAADAMGLRPLLDIAVAMLSAGQRQRAAIARMIASGAQLWLLDEPTNALDSSARARLLAAMARHRASGGLIVAATHQPLPLEGAGLLALESA